MPRVSRAEAERNRELIDQAAAALIRERGLGLRVADVMQAAGMTNGGFYKHFDSRDALVAHACGLAFQDVASRWRGRVASAANKSTARKLLMASYLSDTNCRNPANGCPMVSLASEVSRVEKSNPVRQTFKRGLQDLLKIIEELEPSSSTDERRQQALQSLSLMVGAMTLARATRGSDLSKELMATARKALDCEPADTSD